MKVKYFYGDEDIKIVSSQLSEVFETPEQASEECRKWVQLHGEPQVLYKLVPVSYHDRTQGVIK